MEKKRIKQKKKYLNFIKEWKEMEQKWYENIQ